MATTAAVAAAGAVANAIKASGAIVQMRPVDFQAILARVEEALLVMAEGGVFSTNYQYLTSHRGLIFFTKSPEPLSLPSGAELIRADKIWIPG